MGGDEVQDNEVRAYAECIEVLGDTTHCLIRVVMGKGFGPGLIGLLLTWSV